MNKEEYQKLVTDAVCFSQDPGPEDLGKIALAEFASRVLQYLEGQGSTIAWWDGGRRVTRHHGLPLAHSWPEVVPLVPRYVPGGRNEA